MHRELSSEVELPRSSYRSECRATCVSEICSPCLAPVEGKTCPPPCWRPWSWFLPVDRHISIKQHVISKNGKHSCVKYVDMSAHNWELLRPLLTLSSTISKEKSLPSPLELLQLRIADLLVTLALTVHLGVKTKSTLKNYEWAKIWFVKHNTQLIFVVTAF